MHEGFDTRRRSVREAASLSEICKQAGGVISTPQLATLFSQWPEVTLKLSFLKKCQMKPCSTSGLPSNKHSLNPITAQCTGWDRRGTSHTDLTAGSSPCCVMGCNTPGGSLQCVGSSRQEGWRVRDNESLDQCRGHPTSLIRRREEGATFNQVSTGKSSLKSSFESSHGNKQKVHPAVRAPLFTQERNQYGLGLGAYFLTCLTRIPVKFAVVCASRAHTTSARSSLQFARLENR